MVRRGSESYQVGKGGIYLLSGPPGGGKTTFALQIATDLAGSGHKVLYLALEQSPSDIKHKIEQQIFTHRRGNSLNTKESLGLEDGLKKAEQLIEVRRLEQRVEDNLAIDASVSAMDALPDFLARKVLGATGPYEEVTLIVVDSLQGLAPRPPPPNRISVSLSSTAGRRSTASP